MKSIRIIIGGIVLSAIAYAGVFVYGNFRGAKPAFGPLTVPATPSVAGVAGKRTVNMTGIPLVLEDGLSVSVFAKDVGNARVLAWDSNEVLLVSSPAQGAVFALPDRNKDGVADEKVQVVAGLNKPHGIVFRDNTLYIAETDSVTVWEYDVKTLTATGRKKIVDLPGGGNHFSRTIGFGPDGNLYISVGSSCNVCIEKDDRRAKILVSDPDGTNLRVYASGLRNSVFFRWHPLTRDMWATDMGRDLLGDNIPPEEVNIIREGGFYGWPTCYGDRVYDSTADRSVRAKELCASSIPAHIEFQAHSAPLGLAFVPDSWPAEYRGDLLVSYHGSWNRSQTTGYKIVRFDLNESLNSAGEYDFISGWLTGGQTFGRPVDLLFGSDAALYISDDKSGTIYRVTIRM